MNINVDVGGLDKLKEAIAKWVEKAPQSLGALLHQEAEIVMGDSKEHHVPVDIGALRASGHVLPPEISGDKISVTLGFGGPAAPYALKVHEDLQARHKVGGAKYLEKPFMKRAEGLPQRLAQQAQDLLND